MIQEEDAFIRLMIFLRGKISSKCKDFLSINKDLSSAMFKKCFEILNLFARLAQILISKISFVGTVG